MSDTFSGVDDLKIIHLKENIEGKHGEDNAIFSAGLLMGTYLQSGIPENIRYEIKSIILANINSKITYVAHVCREFQRYINRTKDK